MQSATTRMADDRIHILKFFEGAVHDAVYLAGVGNVGGKISIRRRRNLPVTERPPRLIVVLNIGERQRCAARSQSLDHVLGDRAQSSRDQNRLAGEINADHSSLTQFFVPMFGPYCSLPAIRESTSCPDSVTSTLSSIRAPPPRSGT